MNKALLYQPRQTARVWIALLASVSIHAAALALAQMDRELVPTEETFTPADPGIEIENSSPPINPSPAVEPIETPPPLPPNDESISEDVSPPTTVPRQTRRVAQPLSRLTNDHPARLTNSGSARVLALSAPRPEYPYEARRSRLTGNGIAIFVIDSASGSVLNVTMEKSTGSAILDQATIAGLRRWRFKPGAPTVVRSAITFALTGASF